MEEFANPYKEVSIGIHLVWVVIATIANYSPIEGIVGKCIRSYLALVVWLLIILNKKRNLWQRGIILTLYLKLNSIAKVIENLSYTITIIKIGMLCVSLEQVIHNNTIQSIQIIVLLHFTIIAMYLPDGEEIELKLTEIITD